MTRSRALHLGREVALTVGAIAGSLCLLMLALGAVADVRPLVFRSGSMSPEIATGDLAVVRTVPAHELEPGDVVSVVNARGDRITHRLVRAVPRDDGYDLTLRGDANPVVDAETYPVTEAERVLFTLPYVGRVIAAMSSPAGLVVVGGLAVLLVGIVVRGPKGPGGPKTNPKHRRRRDRSEEGPRVAVALRTGGAAMALVVTGAGGAWAQPWTDTVAISGQQLKASAVTPTSLRCQGLNLLSLRFSWDAVAGATSYTLYYNNGARVLPTTNTTATVGSLVNGGSAWVVAHRDFGSTTWSSANSNSVSYAVLLLAFCS